MWEALWLAGASGSLTAVGVWQLLALVLERLSSSRQMTARLQHITQEGGSTESAEPAATLVRDDRFSVMPSLDRVIRRASFAPGIAIFLQQAGSRLHVGAYLLIHLVCVAAAFLVASWLRLQSVVALAVIVLAGVAPFFVMSAKRTRRLSRLTEQLPDAIRLIAASLRAGLGLDVGLNAVVNEMPDPIRSEFRQLVNEFLLELNIDDAFRRLTERVPLGDYRLFAASACLHRDIGGNFAELLDDLEETVRERFRLNRELKTMTALARIEGLLLMFMPIVGGVSILALSPKHLLQFWTDPAGRLLLQFAIGWQIIGFFVIRRMVRPRMSGL